MEFEGLFFKVVLCVLCMDDVIEAHKRKDQFLQDDPSWGQSREYKLVEGILESIDQGMLKVSRTKYLTSISLVNLTN